MSRWIEPISLHGDHVLLEPLDTSHAAALTDAASDGDLWKLWFTSVPAPGYAESYIATALDMRERLEAMPFAVLSAKDKRVVGSTRYFNVDRHNRRVEIGHTWYAKRVQRTALNTEAKLLLLTHAFETLQCIAVEFRTHWMNHASRAAIARLGAKQDGVLRHHAISEAGLIRDTVVFSIIAPEWPTVRQALRSQLERKAC